MSPLEALACGTQPVCTAVRGMGKLLPGKVLMTPKSDPEKMADAFLWVAGRRDEARPGQAGRELIQFSCRGVSASADRPDRSSVFSRYRHRRR